MTMRRIMWIGVVVALVVIGLVSYEAIRTRMPRRVPTTSRTLAVSGTYWFVDLDHVDDVVLTGSVASVSGFRLKWFGLGSKFETYQAKVLRPLPDVRPTAQPVRPWALVRAEYSEGTRVFTFLDTASRGEFSVELPKGSADLHYQIAKTQRGADLIVFACGDWKVGPPAYCGYVTVER